MSLNSLYKSRPVMPGDVLGVVEEFEPGPWTYVDNEGRIRAATAGVVEYDMRLRIVKVKPSRIPRMPRVGSNVIALVTQVRQDVVFVDLLGEVSLNPPRFLHEFAGTYPGAISIGNIAEEYVKDINDFYRVSDIILAKVISSVSPYHLTTKPDAYGVLYARCAKCGAILQKVDSRHMKCPVCGNVEKRKVSAFVGTRLIRVDLRYLLSRPLS